MGGFKLIVTILQHKRIAAPYFFIKYVYPKWMKTSSLFSVAKKTTTT